MRVGNEKGFSLLEVMVALAILVTALVWVAQAQLDATMDSNRAKMMTVASQLARAKINEIEFLLRREGFSDFEEEECGDFGDEEYGEFEKFKWCYSVEKIELPENLNLQRALGLGGGEEGDGSEGSTPPGSLPSGLSSGALPGGAGGPLASMLGSMGGGASSLLSQGAASLIASQFGIIRNVIEQAIRRVNLTVSWNEGMRERELTIVLYLTDPKVIESQIMGGAGGMPGMPGATGAQPGAGSSGSSSSKSGGSGGKRK
jgi:prepilin-type N-terminal cleavage/methylation domain-containing protein